MPASFLEVQKRNARFRAWKSLGIPVEGRWYRDREGDWRVKIECLACPRDPDFGFPLFCEGRQAENPTPDEQAWGAYPTLEGAEQRALSDIVPFACTHLAPLLGPEPEGFSALVGLELLDTPWPSSKE